MLLAAAAALWLAAAALYAGIPEARGATEGGGNALADALRSLGLLATGGQLSFICADRWMKNRYGGPLRAMVAKDCSTGWVGNQLRISSLT